MTQYNRSYILISTNYISKIFFSYISKQSSGQPLSDLSVTLPRSLIFLTSPSGLSVTIKRYHSVPQILLKISFVYIMAHPYSTLVYARVGNVHTHSSHMHAVVINNPMYFAIFPPSTPIHILIIVCNSQLENTLNELNLFTQ